MGGGHPLELRGGSLGARPGPALTLALRLPVKNLFVLGQPLLLRVTRSRAHTPTRRGLPLTHRPGPAVQRCPLTLAERRRAL